MYGRTNLYKNRLQKTKSSGKPKEITNNERDEKRKARMINMKQVEHKTLTLHIGTEKTGSSSIQKFLKTNQKLLSESGTEIPKTLGDGIHYKLQLMANSDEFQDDFLRNLGLHRDMDKRKKAIAQWRKEFKDEIDNSTTMNWIISCETLHSRLTTEEEIEKLKTILEPLFEVINVLVYLRNPVELMTSRANEYVKSGFILEIPRPAEQQGFDICNHEHTIKTWRNRIGQGEFMPRLFDRSFLKNKDLIDDFCSCCNIDRSKLIGVQRQNSSMPYYCAKLISEVNRYVPRRWVDGTLIKSRWELVNLMRKALKSGSVLQAEDKTIETYRKYYQASNEWVRKEFFQDRQNLFENNVAQKINEEGLSNVQFEEIGMLISTVWMRKNAKINQLQAQVEYLESELNECKRVTPIKREKPSTNLKDYFDC